jgi:hypothetical protein
MPRREYKSSAFRRRSSGVGLGLRFTPIVYLVSAQIVLRIHMDEHGFVTEQLTQKASIGSAKQNRLRLNYVDVSRGIKT